MQCLPSEPQLPLQPISPTAKNQTESDPRISRAKIPTLNQSIKFKIRAQKAHPLARCDALAKKITALACSRLLLSRRSKLQNAKRKPTDSYRSNWFGCHRIVWARQFRDFDRFFVGRLHLVGWLSRRILADGRIRGMADTEK